MILKSVAGVRCKDPDRMNRMNSIFCPGRKPGQKTILKNMGAIRGRYFDGGGGGVTDWVAVTGFPHFRPPPVEGGGVYAEGALMNLLNSSRPFVYRGFH